MGPASSHSFRSVLEFREVREGGAQGGNPEKDVQRAACGNWDGHQPSLPVFFIMRGDLAMPCPGNSERHLSLWK